MRANADTCNCTRALKDTAKSLHGKLARGVGVGGEEGGRGGGGGRQDSTGPTLPTELFRPYISLLRWTILDTLGPNRVNQLNKSHA